ncbi:MAG: 1-deoxy-D-xylulose-5-phosphate reductoisomerase [Phycisphaerales bacterium]
MSPDGSLPDARLGVVSSPASDHTSDVRVRRVIILGSTGSIGRQTVDAIEHLNALSDRGLYHERFEIVGLAAGSDSKSLIEQADQLSVTDCALAEHDQETPTDKRLRVGADAAEQLIVDTDCDLVVGAIVGVAGLPSVLAALERGTDVALANKETLVAAGSLVMPVAKRTGAQILPVDSEHAGIWQCMMQAAGTNYAPPNPAPDDVVRVVLTASGGAFRGQRFEDIANATVDQALAHPTWNMGAKVTIDTATLINKALELVEAHWLFGLGADRLDAVIHPSSTVHALVEMGDGSVVAQMGAPDMRTPILRSLCFPARSPEPLARLDLCRLSELSFKPIDGPWRRGIDLGQWVIRSGGSAGAVFNASNEAAVHAFIDGRIPFGKILDIVELVCEQHTVLPIRTIQDVQSADQAARDAAAQCIGRLE